MWNERLLDAHNFGTNLCPFTTKSWDVFLRQFIPHFLSIYRSFQKAHFEICCGHWQNFSSLEEVGMEDDISDIP